MTAQDASTNREQSETKEPRKPDPDTFIISYRLMRRVIGYFGFFLPFLVVGWANLVYFFELPNNYCHFAEPTVIEEQLTAKPPVILCPTPYTASTSLSAFYHSPGRNLLVGMLVAVGLFMFAYRGPYGEDAFFGRLLCVAAIGTAIFPTEPIAKELTVSTALHFLSAMVLLLGAAALFFWRFTRTAMGDDGNRITATLKQKRLHRVYKACAIAMAASVVGIGIVTGLNSALGWTFLIELGSVTYLEAIALCAFGIGWMTKGRVLFKDS